MRTDLMLEIAGVLDNLSPEERENFNMGNWCGTSACAIGWACLKLESVRKAGLAIFNYRTVDVAKQFGKPLPFDKAILNVGDYGAPYACVGNTVLSAYDAVEHVLDIKGLVGLDVWNAPPVVKGIDQVGLSVALFNHNWYVSSFVEPWEVSKRIREAVAHYDPSHGQSSTSDGSTTSASSIESSSSA
jgi:hypothetical protein